MRKCTRHIAAAVCFRETSHNTLKATGSVLLPAIGFYYALFHLSVAILFAEYTTPLAPLQRIRHRKLADLVNSRLVSRGFLPPDYLKALHRLKKVRETCNYPFPSDGDDISETHSLKKIIAALYSDTEKAFNDALVFLSDVSKETCTEHDLLEYVRFALADVIGDDLYQTYLSEHDEEQVTTYLVNQDLTY